MMHHAHINIGNQIAGAVVRSATSHSVGALMRGHGPLGVIVIAVVLIISVVIWNKF